MRSIVDFRGHLLGSGARPNLFRVTMKFPILAAAGEADELISFLAKAASLPADNLGEIEVPYMGRKTFYPGDRTFDPWTITVICDENFSVRDAFERWMSALNSHVGNTRDPLAATPPGYVADMIIQQLSKLDLPPIKQYKMAAAFPTKLGAMETDWGTNDTLHEFQVDIRYQWWDAVGSGGATTDGDAGPLNG